MLDAYVALIHMLLARLERVPADSVWAHRASGLRGALLEAAEGGSSWSSSALEHLTRQAFEILERAAEDKDRASFRTGDSGRPSDEN